jgi:hypothetical protein
LDGNANQPPNFHHRQAELRWLLFATIHAGRVSVEAEPAQPATWLLPELTFLPKYNFHVMSGRHTAVIKTLKTCSPKRTFIQNGNADNQADICPFAVTPSTYLHSCQISFLVGLRCRAAHYLRAAQQRPPYRARGSRLKFNSHYGRGMDC